MVRRGVGAFLLPLAAGSRAGVTEHARFRRRRGKRRVIRAVEQQVLARASVPGVARLRADRARGGWRVERCAVGTRRLEGAACNLQPKERV